MLTVEETLQQLKISRKTLYNLVKAGKLKSYKAGGRKTYFKPNEVKALFKVNGHAR